MKQKKRVRIGAGIGAVLISIIIAGNALYQSSVEAYAKASLPGVETIVAANGEANPYIILEVVPDKEEAAIGYLMAGEEPLNNGKSYKDLPLKEEREEALKQLAQSVSGNSVSGNTSTFSVSGNTVSGNVLYKDLFGEEEDKPLSVTAYEEKEDATHSFSLRGSFKPDVNGAYVATHAMAEYQLITDGKYDGVSPKYKKYTEFSTLIEDGKVPTFESIGVKTEREIRIEGETSKQVTAYQYTILESWRGTESDLPDLSKMEGELVFISHFRNEYEYVGLVEHIGATRSSIAKLPPSLSGNTVSDNATPENDPTTDPIETATEPIETTTDQITETTTETTAETTTEPFLPYALAVPDDTVIPRAGLSAYAVHAKDGKYLVFDSNDVGTFDAITTEKVGEYDRENYRIAKVSKVDNGTHYISLVSESTGTHATPFVGFEKLVWYNLDENGEYYLASNEEFGYERYDANIHTLPTVERFRWITDYSQPEVEKISYEGGISNKEWFKQYVFDRVSKEEYDKLVIDVKTVTMEEFNAYDLASVDVIYFAGGTTPYDVDINPVQARDLFTKVQSQKMPVIMNLSMQKQNTVALNPNIYKLSILLRQEVLTDISLEKDENEKTILEKEWENLEYFKTLERTEKKVDAVYGLSYISWSIFVFDDTILDNTGKSRQFVSTKFCDKMNDEQIAYGFEVIKNEIENENTYREMAQVEKLETDISQATAIRYIINFASQRNVVKSQIRVLEIQPASSKGYTDAQLKQVRSGGREVTIHTLSKGTITPAHIAENWATQFKGKENDIHLESSYTGEFNGQIKDLNENYDVIFIGTDTSTMNTKINNKNGKLEKLATTEFNDVGMKDLVYYHTGDSALASEVASINLLGLLNPTNVGAETSHKEYRNYRFSGNDITPDKLRELKEYLDAGYPIVFGEGFFLYSNESKTYSVDYRKVDRTSYMYELGQYILDKDYINKRVFLDEQLVVSEEVAKRKDLKNCLNLSKLSVDLTKKPSEYNQSGTSGNYLVPVNGAYLLEYEFHLKNDASFNLLETRYGCELYIDTSVDGRYSEDERIDELQVLELQNGAWNSVDKLRSGYSYRVQRQVPTGYVGVLPWKLVFTQEDNALIRKSVNGYSAVPIAISERKAINVLQIISGNNGQGAFAGGLTLDLKSQQMQTLFQQVQDFDIKITQMTAQQYIRTVTNVTNANSFLEYSAVLNKYDMIVLGFTDGYRFGSGTDNQMKAAALALRQYIKEGRSVLFTHDTTSFYNLPNKPWGYFFNRYIRDMVGMDRYGVMTQIAEAEGFSQVDSVFDVLWVPDSSGATTRTSKDSVLSNKQGYTNGTVMRAAIESGLNGRQHMYTARNAPTLNSSGIYNDNAMYVTELNKGQITEYPFKIPSTFQVANTHAQYYQLNMDTDSRDKNTNDDIVVWYCISDVDGAARDDYYQATPNDARNNYYIYNKGNVTYSGVGHSNVKGTAEMQLFVNTMVAAYNSGIHPASVIYKADGKQNATTIEYTYMPFDNTIDKFIEEECDIYFEVSDTSFMQGLKTVENDYYFEVNNTTEGAEKVTISGREVYLLKLNRSQIKSIVKALTTEEVENIYALENKKMYHMSILTANLPMTNKNQLNLYISAKTTYTRINGDKTTTEKGYYKLGIVKTQLFELE